jgi:ATP-dependent Clp protease adaptor protein ClpS
VSTVAGARRFSAVVRKYWDVAAGSAPTVERVEQPVEDEVVDPDRPWVTIVWNDPVNLMTYVTYVFQKLFGYSKEKAQKLMLQVHREGRAVVSSGTREQMEHDVARLHAYGLWATLSQD